MFRRMGRLIATATAAVTAAAGLAAVSAGPAAAAQAPAPSYVVRSADGVSVEVSTAPFGLRFRDGAGRSVLRSVAGGGGPTPSLHVGDLLGVVGDQTVGPARYAPITFTVGAVTMQQQAYLPQTTGNPVLTASAGVQYSLTDVRSATRLSDGGVRLHVATDDPTGRRAVVDVRPDKGATLRTRVRLVPDTGVSFVGAGFASAHDEAFHGFGGRRNSIDQAGQTFFNWIDQTVYHLPAIGGQPQTGWYQQAQFISSHRYGFFLEQPQLSWWRMRSTATTPGRCRATHGS